MSQGREEWEEKLGERRSPVRSPALCCGGFTALARRSEALAGSCQIDSRARGTGFNEERGGRGVILAVQSS